MRGHHKTSHPKTPNPANTSWHRHLTGPFHISSRRSSAAVAPGVARGSEERKSAIRARSKELTAQGATLLRELDEPSGWCLVMADPEGNKFCLH